MSNKNSSRCSLHETSQKTINNDSIPFRINFIKQLLDNKELKPLVNFDITDTENFIGQCSEKSGGSTSEYSSNDNKTNDTRKNLNKKLYDFNHIISEIGGKLLYIKSGSTGHTFKGIIDPKNDDLSYAVKVVAYPKDNELYGDIYDITRPENAELMMIKLLSYFVIKQKTPHIILPISTFYTNISYFVNLIKDDVVDESNKKYKEFIENYEKNKYHTNVSILISEWATRGDFLDYVRKNYKNFKLIHWKIFFFQIISTLAVIQSKFPSFRHNDFKANNILVTKVPKKANSMSIYTVNKMKYTVPNIGYQIKLWDFDFACIPGIVDNSKVSSEWTKKINVIPEKNRYYDIHYFFNTFIKKGFFSQFIEEDCIPKEAKEFVNRVVPQKYQTGEYVHKRGRILIKDEYTTPDNILRNDPFFEQFRKDKKQNPKPVKNTRKNKSSEFNLVKLEDLLADSST